MKIPFLISILILIFPFQALAESFYISAGPGIVIGEDFNNALVTTKFDPGFSGSIALGKKFNGFRGEVEYGYKKDAIISNLKVLDFLGASGKFKGDSISQSLIFNVYWDIKTESQFFNPYFGSGLGAVWRKTEIKKIGSLDIRLRESDRWFASQFMLGNRVKINDFLFLDVGYNLFLTGNYTAHIYKTKLQLNF